MIKKLPFLALLLASTAVFGQTQLWSENFEDAAALSSGDRSASVAEFKCSSGFFKRTDGSDKTWLGGNFTGFNGSKYFGAMDIDRGPACGSNNTISAAQSITWSGINISGKGGLSFKGLFGADPGTTYQGIFFNDAANNYVMDYMVVEYKIDNGSWTKIIGIYPNSSNANGGAMSVDTNGDMIGDGTVLGYNLSEISANITGTGNTLYLRFNIFVNNQTPGAMAFDNFRIFHTGTLPVTLKHLDVRKESNGTLLHWTTASEQNNKEFVIYRSGEDKKFENIGNVSAGNGNYSFYDRKPLNGDNYYRLVQVDMDGTETELGTKVLNFSLSQAAVSIYPNPASTNATATFRAGNYSSAKLFDQNGKTIRDITVGISDTRLDIDISTLPKGIYFLTFYGKDGKATEKLIKK